MAGKSPNPEYPYLSQFCGLVPSKVYNLEGPELTSDDFRDRVAVLHLTIIYSFRLFAPTS